MEAEKRNILLTIEYDGTGFSGWQRQPGQRTVQGELERVLSVLCAQPIAIDGASRTDAGVHAYGQTATFSGAFGIPTDRIPFAANNLLAGEGRYTVSDVRIKKAVEVPGGFHARFDCSGKKYFYLIRNAASPDPMQRNQCCQITAPLDLCAMREAASYLPGEKDFRAFMSAGGNGSAEGSSTVRDIFSAKIVTMPYIDFSGTENGTEAPGMKDPDQGQLLRFEIEGSGFLYNMVRIIAGTLIEVGLGRRKADTLPEIIESRDRSQAGHTAPPYGLYLAEVYYPIYVKEGKE